MLAALILTPILGGAVGLRDLVARMLRWRVRPLWWLIALAGPLVLFLVAALLGMILVGAGPISVS